tara:strand:+ start:1077 stop:1634 length:558 start_codon:yes stop_codon:yes gene_type:complete
MPTSTLVANEQQNFGNITVSLKSLGNTSYRIEWYSRMTGATTSIAKLGKDNYGVFRKWAENKKLPEVAHSFTKRKSALVHFLNNVDIIRASDSIMNEAKNYCLTLFSKQEDVHIPANHKFARYRLQGAIGQPVIVKPKTTSDYIMAEGILLQLIGDSSEIQLTDFGDLVNRRPVQKFPNRQVFMK